MLANVSRTALTALSALPIAVSTLDGARQIRTWLLVGDAGWAGCATTTAVGRATRRDVNARIVIPFSVRREGIRTSRSRWASRKSHEPPVDLLLWNARLAGKLPHAAASEG